jgi:single-strand DNA-binding protein
MADDSVVEVVGNLARDPELRFTPNGDVFCSFAVAKSESYFDKAKNARVERPASFFDVVLWGSLAENVADSLGKGDRVFVKGVLVQRSWKADDGTQRYAVQIKGEVCGPDLRWASAKVTKASKVPDRVPVEVTAGYSEEPC